MTKLPIGYFRSVYKHEGLFVNDHCFIRHDDTWHFFYIHGLERLHWSHPKSQLDIGHATSPDLIHWTTQPSILSVSEAEWWEKRMVYAPYVIRHQDTFYMLYCGSEAGVQRERIGLATSRDLFHWERYPGNPLISPSKSWAAYGGMGSDDPGSCRDPHVIAHDRYGFIVYWVAERKGDPRYTCVAASVSNDLVHWQEWGPLLKLRQHEPPGTANIESVGVVSYASRYIMFFKYGYGTYWVESGDPLDWEGHEIRFLSTSHASEVFEWEGRWYISSCSKLPQVAASYPAFYKGLYLGRLRWDHFSVSISPRPIGAREGYFTEGVSAEEIHPRVLEADELPDDYPLPHSALLMRGCLGRSQQGSG